MAKVGGREAVNALGRYLHLWRTLPDEERRARAGRVIDRWLRRSRRWRSLVPAEPSWRSLRRALASDIGEVVARLSHDAPRRGPLWHGLDLRGARIAERHHDHAITVIEQARGLLERRFDLLGSGPARPLHEDGRIDWHRDWKSGAVWDPRTYHTDLRVVRGDGSDVKLPWELSRCQHLPLVGQAYRLAPMVLEAADAARLQSALATEAAAQLGAWIEDNPPGIGVNWTCTMDVALRAINWLAALALLRPARELDATLRARLLRSLWSHGRHIRRHLEIGADGLTTNHYLSDVSGLHFLGCALPELHEASEWRRFGRRALIAEMERQVHADGVDFERSTSYHRLATEIFLHGAILARAAGDEMPEAYLERLGRMLAFIAAATREDGTVAQIGDGDDGRLLPLDGYATHAPHDHRHLLALGGRFLERKELEDAGGGHDVEALWLLDHTAVGVPRSPHRATSAAFPLAGFYFLAHDDLHLSVACGPVGTRGAGNHSHNDLFAGAIWADGREWITDPGTGAYTGDPTLRNRLRSTAAHATLQLGMREQNHFGPGTDQIFLMHERAHPEVLSWASDAEGAELVARHRGFSGADGEWIHERRIRFSARARAWWIEDLLHHRGPSAPALEPVTIRFVLAPGVNATIGSPALTWTRPVASAFETHPAAARQRQSGAMRVEARLHSTSPRGEIVLALLLPAASTVTLREAPYSPRYGVALASLVLTIMIPPAPMVEALSLVLAASQDKTP